ncbi:DUF3238 domain-containing protein [Paenibacillus polymyxa]
MAISTAVHIRTFIPLGWFNTPLPAVETAEYEGDNRTNFNFDTTANVSYRTSQRLDIDFDNNQVTNHAKCGETHKRTPKAGGGYNYSKATASASGIKVQNVEWGTEKILDALKGYKYVKFTLFCASANPLVPFNLPAPDIDYQIDFKVWNNPNRNMEVRGRHDGFPAYELMKVFQGRSSGIYSYNPLAHGNTTWNLLPPMDVDFARNG